MKELNINNITPNYARMLDKIIRLYEHILSDPYLACRHPRARIELISAEAILKRLTDPILQVNIYDAFSSPSITPPINTSV